ncbi:aldo/keto reductase [Bifidobacterium eulemuris]|uniref:2,5-diketo-D-gluconic acid reductase n=1 Tax=Bifidobacterium eulemuris TaxID=1765219 RepID=A0A261GDA1_9BIFI|nr:aldo/keto reductase [Bifidobacterium eulemuris]OZG69421.1 2,5-diketo-D-gluconic acid reductase [Bifidobacterium eulemuris]QOL31100.1 aldo/keto reductase [Bifidobacterium eulemuris]
METITLNNGVTMPALGLGVFQMRDHNQCERTVATALELGYRLIDTAQSYGNEAAVGNAISRSGIPRDELFVTTKLKVANLTYDRARTSLLESLHVMRLDYVDLLLIHHPYNDVFGAWRAMRELRDEGFVRAIGVSNFPPDRLEDLVLHGGETPQLMQIEMHPFNQQHPSMELMRRHNIRPEAWGPLAQGKFGIFDNPTLMGIADEHEKTVAQVVLRWLLQRGVTVIPKTVHEERLRENLDVFDFTLRDDEMLAINALDQNLTVTPQMREPFWIDNLSSF